MFRNEGGNNQIEDAREESLHRHGNTFANVTSIEAEVQDAEGFP